MEDTGERTDGGVEGTGECDAVPKFVSGHLVVEWERMLAVFAQKKGSLPGCSFADACAESRSDIEGIMQQLAALLPPKPGVLPPVSESARECLTGFVEKYEPRKMLTFCKLAPVFQQSEVIMMVSGVLQAFTAAPDKRAVARDILTLLRVLFVFSRNPSNKLTMCTKDEGAGTVVRTLVAVMRMFYDPAMSAVDTEVLRGCCECVGNIAVSDEGGVLLGSAGLVGRLLQIVETESSQELLESALWALGNLTTGNERNQITVVYSMDMLANKMKSLEGIALKDAFLVASNVCAFQLSVDAILKHGILEMACSMIVKEKEFTSEAMAPVPLILSYCYPSEPASLSFLVDSGVFRALMMHLKAWSRKVDSIRSREATLVIDECNTDLPSSMLFCDICSLLRNMADESYTHKLDVEWKRSTTGESWRASTGEIMVDEDVMPDLLNLVRAHFDMPPVQNEALQLLGTLTNYAAGRKQFLESGMLEEMLQIWAADLERINSGENRCVKYGILKLMSSIAKCADARCVIVRYPALLEAVDEFVFAYPYRKNHELFMAFAMFVRHFVLGDDDDSWRTATHPTYGEEHNDVARTLLLCQQHGGLIALPIELILHILSMAAPNRQRTLSERFISNHLEPHAPALYSYLAEEFSQEEMEEVLKRVPHMISE